MWDENKVRIIDIAEELGVSTATVSNVLHGKTNKVSKSTIERVQRALEERHYITNMAATLLAQNDSRIIGVVINDHPKYEGHLLEDPFLASAVNYLADEIDKAGYFMMLKKERDIRQTARFASMWNIDGMVVIGFCEDEYQELRDSIRIPFVIYDGEFENKGRICNLIADDFGGGKQMGEHLKALGHKRVLCVADNEICMDLKRYLGLCDGLGFKADRLIIPMKKNNRLAFYKEHLDELKKYTAIFAVSDFYAVELMRFLQEQGLRVPEDISVAGFDGMPLCRQVVPTLTTIVQDNALRAKTAMEQIKKMNADKEYKNDIIIPVKLQTGGSTAAIKCE